MRREKQQQSISGWRLGRTLVRAEAMGVALTVSMACAVVLALIGTPRAESVHHQQTVSSGEALSEASSEAWPPDLDPERYFPTRPFMRDFGERVVREVERSAFMGSALMRGAIDVVRGDLETLGLGVMFEFYEHSLYRAAIEAGDCRLANDLIWRAFTGRRLFLEGVRSDSRFQRLMVRDIFVPYLPELAACLYAQDGRTLHQFVATLSRDSRENQLQGTPFQHLRPFVYRQSWVSAQGTIHGRRDWNYWQLIEMASDPTQDGYAPAGVLLVELALELDSLNLPGDILHMLLLRADAAWDGLDPERPVPVTRDRIAELLPTTAARLSDDQLAHAERCFLTDEPYRRLFLGEQAYWDVPAAERCVASDP